MAILVCGSLAFDTITVFPGRFADQILPEQLHILNVSFLVPTLRREFGGCAGNIAYTLKLLGGEPVVLAALGNDGSEYLAHLKKLGISTDSVYVASDNYTAQAIIITDSSNNQITAFHPGAMMDSHLNHAGETKGITLGIVAPDGADGMRQHVEELAAAGVPFVFDPGQGLPMFDGADLRAFIAQASWVTVNDYEAKMLVDRTGLSLAELSTSHLKGVIVTLGDQGCEVWEQGVRTHVPGVVATEVLDPTGCGDAFRGALLYGLELGWPLVDCVKLGNRIGAVKIACRGGQNHPVDKAALGL